MALSSTPLYPKLWEKGCGVGAQRTENASIWRPWLRAFPEGLTNARIHVHKVLFLTPLSKIITIKDAKCASQLWAYRRSDNVSVCAWSNTFIVLQKCIAAQCSRICAHNLTFSVRWALEPFLWRKGFPPHNHLSKFTLILSTRRHSSTGETRQICIYRGFRVLPFGKQAAYRCCLVGRSLSRR